MRNFTRFIPQEDIDAVAEWRFGSVDSAATLLEKRAREQEEQDQISRLEEFRRAAFEAGFADGVVHGRDQTMLEAQQKMDHFMQGQGQETARQLAAILSSAQEGFDLAEKAAAQGVLDLACAVARQVLRHELSVNPNVLLPVIRESLASLFSEDRPVTIKLHPLDLDMLQEALRQEYPGLTLNLLADVSLSRGGCLVESAGTVVDATLEQRWARAVSWLGRDLPWQEEGEVHAE